MPIVHTENLKVYFKQKGNLVKAVDGLDIFFEQAKVTALAGESGCGKTTLAKTILGFNRPSEGRVFFNGFDITNPANERIIRKNIRIVFQNPGSSFDPRFKIFDSLYEGLSAAGKLKKSEAATAIGKAVSEVELAADILKRYPHQLSGGQLQRVSLARALINNVSFVILDEPTSSLDIINASKIITLLKKIKENHKTTFLFISHNLRLIRLIADYCFIMYRGKIVESGPKEALYKNPQHPYTKLLLNALDFKLSDEKG